jgi:hypothetical protein
MGHKAGIVAAANERIMAENAARKEAAASEQRKASGDDASASADGAQQSLIFILARLGTKSDDDAYLK